MAKTRVLCRVKAHRVKWSEDVSLFVTHIVSQIETNKFMFKTTLKWSEDVSLFVTHIVSQIETNKFMFKTTLTLPFLKALHPVVQSVVLIVHSLTLIKNRRIGEARRGINKVKLSRVLPSSSQFGPRVSCRVKAHCHLMRDIYTTNNRDTETTPLTTLPFLNTPYPCMLKLLPLQIPRRYYL